MPKPHWFPFYVSDFLSSPTVTLMTAEEVGGYLLLLCYAWQDPKGSLPNDDESLRVLSRVRSDLSRIKSCFKEKNGRLYNIRLTQEREKAQEKSEAAKKSIAIRWHSERNTNVMRTKYSSQSQSESQSEKKEVKTCAKASLHTISNEEWELAASKFWNVYPTRKHVGKGLVWKWFEKRKPDDRLMTKMLVTLNALSTSGDWTKDSGKYIPNPLTWLNRDGWDDEIVIPPPTPRKCVL